MTLENALLAGYFDAVQDACAAAGPDVEAALVELAGLRDMVRGYEEEIKLANVRRFTTSCAGSASGSELHRIVMRCAGRRH